LFAIATSLTTDKSHVTTHYILQIGEELGMLSPVGDVKRS